MGGEPCVVLRAAQESARDRWPPWADPGVAIILRHPTIVQMLDDGELDGYRYFSFEYVDGVDLRQLLNDVPLPPNAALTIIRTIVDALCVASEAVGLDGSPFEFLHGCISPRWVFVSRRGEVKLGGFGFGYIKPERERGLDDVICAPEQLRGGDQTAQTDMFQVGLLLHRMLFGSEFVSEGLARVRAKVAGHGVATATVTPYADPQLEKLLRRLLAERPEDRFASITEVRDAIRSLAGAEATSEGHRWLAAHASISGTT